MMDFGDPRLPARFWTKCTVDNSGCWNWTGAFAGNSRTPQIRWRIAYGEFQILTAYRAPLLVLGVAIEGLNVYRKCENERCVNPACMLVCDRETLVALLRERRPYTHCIRGHEIAVVGYYVTNRDTSRRCKECQRERTRAYASALIARDMEAA